MSCPRSSLDGAYVLGALAPAERLEFERHLATCADCARAVRELAGLPGLLAQVDPTVLETGDPPVPDTLLPSVIHRVRRDRRRRTVRLAVAAAAASVVLTAGGLVVVRGLPGSGTSPVALPGASSSASTGASSSPIPTSAAPTGRAMVGSGDSPIVADIALASVAWGTRLDLTCTYKATIDARHDGYVGTAATYALVVRSREGRDDQVATWRAVPGKTLRIAAATATRAWDIDRVEVRDGAGDVVLTLAG